MDTVIVKENSKHNFHIAFFEKNHIYRIALIKNDGKWHVCISNQDLANDTQRLMRVMEDLFQSQKIQELRVRNNISLSEIIFHSKEIFDNQEYGGIKFLF